MAKVIKQDAAELEDVAIESQTKDTVTAEWITNAGHCIIGEKVELDRETYTRLKNKGLVK